MADLNHDDEYPIPNAGDWRSRVAILTVPNGQSLSNEIRFEAFITGILLTPMTLNATTVIGFKVASRRDGQYYTLYDSTGALVSITPSVAESRAYRIPIDVFGANWLKLFTCTSAGVAVAQTGAKGFTLMLK